MSTLPKFTICIPNFNYENYLPTTINSVLAQDVAGLEIVIADNSSTDASVKVIDRYMQVDERIRLKINRTNVGFAGNLEKVASMARGEWMTMLSSDDLLEPDFLPTLDKLIAELGEVAKSTIFSATQTVIDGDGKAYDTIPVDWKQWKDATRDQTLSKLANADVYRIDAKTLLKQSLRLLRTPFPFASTTYPRTLYEAAEGYSQTSVINPDKKFAWAILAHASDAIVIDKPLVRYRVHNRNQGSQQSNSGALKHLVDQYIATFTLDSQTLNDLSLTREDVEKAFIEEDIALRSLLAASRGDRDHARRALRFGDACYPMHVRRNHKCWALRFALALGPVGSWVLRYLKKTQLRKYQKSFGSPKRLETRLAHQDVPAVA